MSDKIKIKTVSGGNSEDQDDLKNCYFEETSTTGQYDFYDKHGNQVETTPTPVTSGTQFTFSFADDRLEVWTITATFSGTGNQATASGTWLNNADEFANDDGSFQADAKGTPEEEEASSASA